MAHKVNIGGTFYEITGGKTLVGGTVYSIKNGKTLVDGTAYEVGFAPPVVTIILCGDFEWSGVRYNGVYYGSNHATPITFTANVGDEIYVETFGYTDSPIYLNGNLVDNVPSETEYYYTVVSDTVITAYAWGSSYDSSSKVDIYEIPESYAQVQVNTNKQSSSSSSDAKAVFTFPEPTPTDLGRVTTLTLNASSGRKAFFAPLGTTVACTVKQEKGNARITLNGTTVKSGSGTYNYTVTKDVLIDLTSYHETSNNYGRITITET